MSSLGAEQRFSETGCRTGLASEKNPEPLHHNRDPVSAQEQRSLIPRTNLGAGMQYRKCGNQICTAVNVKPLAYIPYQKLHAAIPPGKLVPVAVVLHNALLIHKAVFPGQEEVAGFGKQILRKFPRYTV